MPGSSRSAAYRACPDTFSGPSSWGTGWPIAEKDLVIVPPFMCSAALPLLHPIGDTFRHHDRGRVGVGAGDVGHDRGIHHPQALDPMHPTVLVHHGHGVR